MMFKVYQIVFASVVIGCSLIDLAFDIYTHWLMHQLVSGLYNTVFDSICTTTLQAMGLTILFLKNHYYYHVGALTSYGCYLLGKIYVYLALHLSNIENILYIRQYYGTYSLLYCLILYEVIFVCALYAKLKKRYMRAAETEMTTIPESHETTVFSLNEGTERPLSSNKKNKMIIKP